MVRRHGTLVLGAALIALAASADAQEKSGLGGRQLYERHCASCHGPRAGGGGWMTRFLTRTPPALNTLSSHFGGKFPAEIVRSVIDGRRQVAMHGPRDMPVWGEAFEKSQAAENIHALVAYLEQIQR